MRVGTGVAMHHDGRNPRVFLARARLDAGGHRELHRQVTGRCVQGRMDFPGGRQRRRRRVDSYRHRHVRHGGQLARRGSLLDALHRHGAAHSCALVRTGALGNALSRLEAGRMQRGRARSGEHDAPRRRRSGMPAPQAGSVTSLPSRGTVSLPRSPARSRRGADHHGVVTARNTENHSSACHGEWAHRHGSPDGVSNRSSIANSAACTTHVATVEYAVSPNSSDCQPASQAVRKRRGVGRMGRGGGSGSR